MDEPTFQIVRDKKVIGAFSLLELRAKLRVGDVRPTDIFWTEGMSEWAPVSALKSALDEMEVAEPNKPLAPKPVPRVVPRPQANQQIFPGRKPSSGGGSTLFIFIAGVLILAWLFKPIFTFKSYRHENIGGRSFPKPAEDDIISKAKPAVLSQLVAPATARFSGERVSLMIPNGRGWECVVRGQVDSQNAFGALLRADWSVRFQYNPETRSVSEVKCDIETR